MRLAFPSFGLLPLLTGLCPVLPAASMTPVAMSGVDIVLLRDGGNPVVVGTTDVAGEVEFTVPDEGRYRLSLRCPALIDCHELAARIVVGSGRTIRLNEGAAETTTFRAGPDTPLSILVYEPL